MEALEVCDCEGRGREEQRQYTERERERERVPQKGKMGRMREQVADCFAIF